VRTCIPLLSSLRRHRDIFNRRTVWRKRTFGGGTFHWKPQYAPGRDSSGRRVGGGLILSDFPTKPHLNDDGHHELVSRSSNLRSPAGSAGRLLEGGIPIGQCMRARSSVAVTTAVSSGGARSSTVKWTRWRTLAVSQPPSIWSPFSTRRSRRAPCVQVPTSCMESREVVVGGIEQAK
jgi:hypothetical protein